ncbi:MAG: efflux RND transporter periplasmic adaptor subunit [Terriglobia bacterium]
MKKKLLIGGVLLLLVILVVAGISWSKKGTVTVQTGKVAKEDLASVVTASGDIEPPPDKWANVNANSMGKITELLIKEGDKVKKGQLLLRTQDIQAGAAVQGQEAAVKTAEADLAAQQATVDSAAAALRTAEANLAQAQAKYKQASDDYTRSQESFKQDLIARQVFDQDLSNYEVAKANVQSAEAQVSQQKALYQQAIQTQHSAQARLSQNKAQLVSYNDMYSQTIYNSPLEGVITSLPVHQGENVVPGIQNSVGSVLFQVSDLSVITAVVKVDESDIVNVKLGQPAEVTIDAIPNATFKGKVTDIGESALSQSTGQTTTGSTSGTTSEEAKDFKVVVTLDNPPPNMRPGLSATAKITTATRQSAVAIPIQALTIRTRGELEQTDKPKSGQALAATKPEDMTPEQKAKAKEELQGVFVVDKDGKAKFRELQTGIMGSMEVEVLKGLQAGDQIVTGSYQVLRTLKNDTKVKIDNTAAATPNAAQATS